MATVIRLKLLCVALTLMMTVGWPSWAEERALVLEAGEHASAEEARSVWKPIEGSLPIEVTDEGGLRLPCNFDVNKGWRVGWDKDGHWDLSSCRDIVVEIVENPDRQTPLMKMWLFVHSDGGWYYRIFEVARGDCRIALARDRFGSEGTPGGWNKVDKFRLTVQNSAPISQAIHVKSITAPLAEPKVAIYQNDAGADRKPEIVKQVQRMAARLDRLEIDYQVLDDDAVIPGNLAGFEIMILPMNPVLPARVAAVIKGFVRRGGKLIVCGPLPGPLGEVLGVEGADEKTRQVPSNHSAAAGSTVTESANGFWIAEALTDADGRAKDQMLFSMIRGLSPGAMQVLYERRESELGRDAGFAGSVAIEEAIAKNLETVPNDQEAKEALAAGRTALADARKAAQSGDFEKGTELIERAEREYLRSYALSVPGKADEFRAFWCCDPRGTAGTNWDAAIASLARGGFNAVIPVMLYAGGAAYQSEILPVSPAVAGRGDLLAECVAAGKKHGVDVYPGIVCYWLWGKSATFPRDAALAEKLTRENRLQVGSDGKPREDHLCPSHPDNQKLELDAILEMVRNYDVAGIMLDYIRYSDDKCCYCDGCRRRFEEQNKLTVKSWPDDVYSGALKEKYRQFRRDNITHLVAAVSQGVRRIKPEVQISAAVLTDGAKARDVFGQDWKLWLEKGYLDSACPMTYNREVGPFEACVRRDRNWAGREAKLMPGITNCWTAAPEQTLRHIVIAREHGGAGFFLHNYGAGWQAEMYRPFLRSEAAEETTDP